MYTMSQINHIKDLSSCGYRISEISKETGADPKTIKKYLAQEDFPPMPPVVQGQPSKLDPFKPVIQEWLDEDKRHWRKHHHTAKRVYERLVEEHGYTSSYRNSVSGTINYPQIIYLSYQSNILNAYLNPTSKAS